MQTLKYTPTEKISIARPVERIKYILDNCRNKNVLDLGCFDETARVKENSGNYLFEEISKVSSLHIGVDNSKLLPAEGLHFNDGSKIFLGSIYDLDQIEALKSYQFDVIIAGELIEHLPDTLKFFNYLKETATGTRLICSTPNATNFSNLLLALTSRESCHIDHLQVYSYKTLHTLCRSANFQSWQIIPYHVKYTEMIMNTPGIKKQLVKFSQSVINGIEKLFPMTAGGYLLDITI